MCVGVPMQIVESGFGTAICNHNGVKKQIDTLLIGEQPPGTWILVFIDAAREVIAEEDALKINDALKALDIVMNGGGDIEHLFADLILAEDRNDQNPTDLKKETK